MTSKEMTNGEVKSLITVIDSILADKSTKLPVKVVYALTRNRAKLISKDKIVEETRLDLVKRHGKEDDKGVTRVQEENMAVFQKEYLELLNEKVDVDVYELKLSHLESAVNSIGGVENLHLLFDYIIDDSGDEKEEKEINKEVEHADA